MSDTKEKKSAGRLRRFFRRVFCRKTVKRIFWGGVALLTVWVLFCQVERWRGAKAWNAAKKEYLEAGGTLDILELLLLKPVPAEENFGALAIFKDVEFEESELGKKNRERLEGAILKAKEKGGEERPKLSQADGRQTYLKEYAEYLGVEVDQENPEEVARGLLAHIETQSGDVIEEMRIGLERPVAQFCGDRRQLFAETPLYEISIPHVLPLVGLSRTLKVRGIAAIELGEREVARDSLALCFQLSHLVDQEFLVGLLIAVVLDDVALELVRHGMERGIWTEEDLQWLVRQKFNESLLSPMLASLKGEAIFSIQAMDIMKGGKERACFLQMIKNVSNDDQGYVNSLFPLVMPAGWLDLNKVEVLQFYTPLLSLEEGPQDVSKILEVLNSVDEKVLEMAGSFSPSTFIISITFPAIFQVGKKVAVADLRRQLMLAACAVENFRLTHGRVPKELAELVPEFASEVSLDPMDGSPLRYELNGDDGYILYSIGLDQEDNGGKRSESPRKNEKGTDLVWRVR